jgi:hypothetical protein
MAAQPLDPGAGDDAAHGEAQDVEWLPGPEGRLNGGGETLGRDLDGGGIQGERQGRLQQALAPAGQLPIEPVEDPGRVEQAMDQDQRRRRLKAVSHGSGEEVLTILRLAQAPVSDEVDCREGRSGDRLRVSRLNVDSLDQGPGIGENPLWKA